MAKQASVNHEKYNPGRLIDFVRTKLAFKTDTLLAAELGVSLSLISRIRKGSKPLTSNILISIHDATGVSILELKQIMGDRRRKQRVHNLEYLTKVRHVDERVADGYRLQLSDRNSNTLARQVRNS